jgi:hypothetical protein
MTNYNNPYVEKIFALLKPLVGEMMANGIISSQSKKLGVDVEKLTVQHLSVLADNIKNGLILFIGSEAAETVSKEIREIK